MTKRILIILLIFIAIALVLLWILSGGISNIANRIKTFANLGSGTSTGLLRLPWQPESLALGPDISHLLNRDGVSDSRTTEEEIAALEQEYENLDKAAREAREFGTPSPFRGDIRIEQETATEENVSAEYVTLFAAWDNTTPIDITGWSLQSALSGVRAYIPRGADNFYMGVVNEQKNIQLNPGASAKVASGYSPLGTSFRENMCSGYLNQLQTFSPPLSEQCPMPGDALPLSAENINAYGDACIDFVRTLPSCSAPLQSFTPELSPSCRNFLANTLSYNGCVSMYRHRSSFAGDSWRVYLNASRELWRNSHDVIRLLDAEGRTVDAITY